MYSSRMTRWWLTIAFAAALSPEALAAPVCKLAAKKVHWPEHTTLLALDKVVIGARWDAKQGIVLSNLETGAAFGKPVALPASPSGLIYELLRTTEGFVAVVRLGTSADDEGGRLFVVRFKPDGTLAGKPHEIAHDLAPIPMPGFDVASLGSKLALLEETKFLKHSQVQIIDLDGRPLGAAVDANAGRIGLATAIGTDGKALAVILRDSAGGAERLRVFDVGKNAWISAATPLPSWNIYGMATFGTKALLFGVGKPGMSGATVGADGKLGAWKLWHAMGLYDTGGWLASSPDASRAYVEYSVKAGPDAKETSVISTIQPDLTVKRVARRPSPGFTSASPHATASAIFLPGGGDYVVLRCR